MYACLAVTCHLHFWQNDRDLLRATAITRGWNGYRNKSQHRKLSLGSCRDSNPGPFDHESDALTTELFPLPGSVVRVRYRLPLNPTISRDLGPRQYLSGDYSAFIRSNEGLSGDSVEIAAGSLLGSQPDHLVHNKESDDISVCRGDEGNECVCVCVYVCV